MRDIKNIRIEEIILHIIDPQGQGLVLSNVALPLDDQPTLRNYFNDHIQSTLIDPGTKAARFRNINPDQPSGACRGLLRKDLNLVEGSQQLAQSLYSILDHDHRITSGDLAVCLFQAEKYPYSRFLAILKIDPSQIFSHTIRQDKKGESYISFEPIANGFTSERLQKCAIIQPLEPRHPEFDMLLLDRQRRGVEDSPVARFFSETFLDAVEAFDARKFTENLSKSLIGMQNRLREQLTPQEEQELDGQIHQAINSRRFNLDRWLAELDVSEQVKDEFDQAIRQTVPARDFSLDAELSQKLTRTIKLRGDHGLHLEIPAEFYQQIVVSEERVTDDPDEPPYYRLVIKTKALRRVI